MAVRAGSQAVSRGEANEDLHLWRAAVGCWSVRAARGLPGDRPGRAKREPGRVAMDVARAASTTRAADGGAP